MRKMIVFVSSVFLLTGCFNAGSVSVVEDMYEQALLENEAAVATYFSEEFLSEHPIEELVEGLAAQVRSVEGVKLLNAIELNHKQLNPEIVEELNGLYEGRWHYVVNDAGGETIMTWVVLKTSSQYEIVEAEKVTNVYYNEFIKNE